MLAIACGVVDGLALGQNARAALIARGYAEMLRFGEGAGRAGRNAGGPVRAGRSGADLFIDLQPQFLAGQGFGRRRGPAALMGDRRTVADRRATPPRCSPNWRKPVVLPCRSSLLSMPFSAARAQARWWPDCSRARSRPSGKAPRKKRTREACHPFRLPPHPKKGGDDLATLAKGGSHQHHSALSSGWWRASPSLSSRPACTGPNRWSRFASALVLIEIVALDLFAGGKARGLAQRLVPKARARDRSKEVNLVYDGHRRWRPGLFERRRGDLADFSRT